MAKRQTLLVLILLCVLSLHISSQEVKLASSAPEATPWGEGLNRMAAEWSRITNGRVRVTVFHGGVAGSEADTIRKIRLGQLQAMVLTTAGMTTIAPETLGLAAPGLIANQEELEYVLDNMEEDLNQLFSSSGYEVLAWSNAGWLSIFANRELDTPDNLDGIRIASGSVPEQINNLFREIGMQPVPLTGPEILGGLNSGLVNAVIGPPLVVAGFQWFGIANNMLDVQIAPFLGNIVIDRRVWNRIPRQYHEELMASARKVGEDIELELDRLESDALALMRQFGLSVSEVDEPTADQWYRAFNQTLEAVGGDFIENEIVDKARELLAEFRR